MLTPEENTVGSQNGIRPVVNALRCLDLLNSPLPLELLSTTGGHTSVSTAKTSCGYDFEITCPLINGNLENTENTDSPQGNVLGGSKDSQASKKTAGLLSFSPKIRDIKCCSDVTCLGIPGKHRDSLASSRTSYKNPSQGSAVIVNGSTSSSTSQSSPSSPSSSSEIASLPSPTSAAAEISPVSLPSSSPRIVSSSHSLSTENDPSDVRIDNEAPKRDPHQKNYDLPPCRICGDKGTGFHYGANTCKACKVFFWRSLMKKADYVCKKGGHCRLLPRQTMCSQCRLEKCRSIGMSINGIKTGRYTTEKRRRDVREVRRMTLTKVTEEQEREDNVNTSRVRHLVNTVVEARRNLFREWEEVDRKLPGILQAYAEARQLRDEIIGPMKPVSNTDFEQVLEKTGIQLDDRLEIFREMVDLMDYVIKRRIRFLRCVPGFSDLDPDDQILLLKASMLEHWLIDRVNYFNLTYRVFTAPFAKTIELQKMVGEQMANEICDTAAKLQQLNLNSEERVMLATFAALSPDRPTLKNRDEVERIQGELLEALLWLLRRNHPGDHLLFPRIISILTRMREVFVMASPTTANMMLRHARNSKLKLPEIVHEFIVNMPPL